MKKITILTFALAVLALPVSAAQLYRWVDERGRVEWRDTPPPPNAKKIEQRNISTSTIQTGEMPYSLQQAVKNFPVTLWTTSCGETCDKARTHLARRGVPHTERNPQSEIEDFKKIAGGGMEVPLLMVGNNRLKGYLESSWDSALDAAGYPKTALIAVKPVIKPAAPASKPAPAATPDGANASPPPAAPAQ
ncbi:MAG: glutaredoxin family protein [Pseudomonadota bacterium]